MKFKFDMSWTTTARQLASGLSHGLRGASIPIPGPLRASWAGRANAFMLSHQFSQLARSRSLSLGLSVNQSICSSLLSRARSQWQLSHYSSSASPVDLGPTLGRKRQSDDTNSSAQSKSHTFEEDEGAKGTQRIVGWWYLLSGSLVFTIVVVGGLTRLTESGLSIVEWNLIKGMKPPTSEQEWEEEFAKYKEFPEYKM